jgi:hypothetical protein
MPRPRQEHDRKPELLEPATLGLPCHLACLGLWYLIGVSGARGYTGRMTWTRVGLGVLALTGASLAQDSAPLRFTAALDSVVRYGGKSESSTGQAFVFATNSDGSSVVPDGLKAAFERQLTRFAALSGPSVAFTNSTETVHDVLEDGSRVVLIEAVSQSTAPIRLGAAQQVRFEMTRTHGPDGRVTLEDVFVSTEGEFRPGFRSGDDESNESMRQAVSVSTENNLRLQAQILEACYRSAPGASVPLILDPKRLVGPESDTPPDQLGPDQLGPDQLGPVRLGDVRVSSLPDGGAECRVSLDPKRYAVGVGGTDPGNVRFVTRQTMRFGPDGTLEHSEFVSSTRFGTVQNSEFEFEGKTYAVRSIFVGKSTGSNDRLR